MRHIPSSDTFHAGVLSFEEALVPTAADYDRSRWLYVPDHYSEYRYILGTRGSRPLICIGINPSTAAPDRLDNTLKSAQRIALHNGSDSFIMWGAIITKRSYLPGCVRDLAEVGQRYGARWFTAGPRSKAGHPHHPLYLRSDTLLDPFPDLEAYLSSVSPAL